MEVMNCYTISLGLKDKDSRRQHISTKASHAKVEKLLQTVGIGGATVYEAKGLYTHECGTLVSESTLRIELLQTSLDKVKELSTELKRAFNQESVLVNETSIRAKFL